MPIMLSDEFEPMEISALLTQVFAYADRTALNRNGFADYLFEDWAGEKEQFERKQVGEILSDMNGVEYQIRKELDKVRRTNLLVEGIVTPDGRGGCQVWYQSANGRIMRPGHRYSFTYSRFESWLWGMEEAGVTVWRTNNQYATADAIAMRAKAVLRQDHTTLARHLKQLPQFHADKRVQSLMGIVSEDGDVRIGPDKAEMLINVFGSIIDILNSSPETISEYVPGIGVPGATALLKAAGRKL